MRCVSTTRSSPRTTPPTAQPRLRLRSSAACHSRRAPTGATRRRKGLPTAKAGRRRHRRLRTAARASH
eukprot:1574658-Prymnesium_polylepis.1